MWRRVTPTDDNTRRQTVALPLRQSHTRRTCPVALVIVTQGAREAEGRYEVMADVDGFSYQF